MTIILLSGKVITGIKEIIHKTDKEGMSYFSCIYKEPQPSTKILISAIDKIVIE